LGFCDGEPLFEPRHEHVHCSRAPSRNGNCEPDCHHGCYCQSQEIYFSSRNAAHDGEHEQTKDVVNHRSRQYDAACVRLQQAFCRENLRSDTDTCCYQGRSNKD
jgi:hypothetical protein